jgi:uncharacterized protein DUF3224
MTQHAAGTFEVRITPKQQSSHSSADMPTGLFRLEKTFTGPITGKAVGTMISAGTPTPGAAACYVALDTFSGTLDGKRGSFVLIHRGVMSKSGVSDLDIRIATDSGTGGLVGIAGALSIETREGKHFYELTYTLPT